MLKLFNIFKSKSYVIPSFCIPAIKKDVEIKKGDFVIIDWFLQEQTAEVRSVNYSNFKFDNRYELYILPLTHDLKRYNSKLSGFDFLYLKEYVGWFNLCKIKRIATESEIKNIKKEYPFWN
jgi:hypothetical protein